jgi:hypothetical protein
MMIQQSGFYIEATEKLQTRVNDGDRANGRKKTMLVYE